MALIDLESAPVKPKSRYEDDATKDRLVAVWKELKEPFIPNLVKLKLEKSEAVHLPDEENLGMGTPDSLLEWEEKRTRLLQKITELEAKITSPIITPQLIVPPEVVEELSPETLRDWKDITASPRHQ